MNDIRQAEMLMKRYAEKYAASDRTIASTWKRLGAVQEVRRDERGVRLACQHGTVQLHWLAVDLLRVRWQPNSMEFTEPFSYALEKTQWHDIPFSVQDSGAVVELRTAAAICRVQKAHTGIEVLAPDGSPLLRDSTGIEFRPDGALRLTLAMQPDEYSYGLGERASGLNLRGRRYALWNTDFPHYMRGSDPLYYNIPFYLGLHQYGAYGVFWDNSHRGLVDVGSIKKDDLSFFAEKGQLCYYIFAGSDAKNVLARFTELTGRIALPPLWALGYQQSRYSYMSQDEVLKTAHTIRERHIPCDVIYLDIHYMDGYRVFTWDKKRFPDLKGMIAQLHKMGFKVIVILDPGIKIDPDYTAHETGMARDVYVTYPDGVPVTGVVWAGASHFPDFTDPVARAWWAEQCKVLLDAGVDGFWNDMCEPAVFGLDGGVGTLPDFARHDFEGRGADHLQAHNLYGTLMGRASQDALRQYRAGLRPTNIIRAGYAGAQRYAMTWTGDNAADWDHLRLSIPMTLNMGLSGAPMTGPDVGGFSGDSEGELLARWTQLACLLPYFRNHAAVDTRRQEPWAFGQPYEAVCRAAITLRYRLLPYLYACVAQAKEFGTPIVRPLFMADPGNPDLRGVDDAYMLGDALLVAPILEKGANRRRVYLPSGIWYDFWTHRRYPGKQVLEVTAALEHLPLFVRAGTALPLYPEMQHTGESLPRTLQMRVYPGVAETVLYEDAGEGMGYEQGDYRWVYMNSAWEENIFTLKRRTAGRYQPPYEAIKLDIYGMEQEPLEVRVDRRPAPVWYYEDGLLELTIDPFSLLEITRPLTPAESAAAKPH